MTAPRSAVALAEKQARAELSAASNDFAVPVSAYSFRSLLSRRWPPALAAVLVADPGAALDGATVATVAHIIMEGRGVLLCSNCSITRDRIKRGLLALLGDAATGGRA